MYPTQAPYSRRALPLRIARHQHNTSPSDILPHLLQDIEDFISQPMLRLGNHPARKGNHLLTKIACVLPAEVDVLFKLVLVVAQLVVQVISPGLDGSRVVPPHVPRGRPPGRRVDGERSQERLLLVVGVSRLPAALVRRPAVLLERGDELTVRVDELYSHG